MSVGDGSRVAETKFWNTPELVEKLVFFLDASSILNLAQTHHLTQQICQLPFVWNQLVRRSCPYNDWPVEEAEFLRIRAEVCV